MKEKIVITGGSGLIGIQLTALLLQEGYEVVHLTRSKNSRSGVKTYLWNHRNNYIEPGALDGASYIIHLAGAGIADSKWTDKRKQLIINSRTSTANCLLRHVKTHNIPLKAFLSASGINCYGSHTAETIYTEDDPFATDFTGECVRLWEESVFQFENICRTAAFRIGVVFDKEGGALTKLEKPIQFGVGAALGSGKQYIPWIHANDVSRLFLFGLRNNISGAYNAIANEHITNRELTKAIGKALKIPVILPNVPAFVLRVMFGEMAALILEGSRASNTKITQAGFEFKYPDLQSALKEIYG